DVTVAFQARVRLLGLDASDAPTASLSTLRASIADSRRARALLSNRVADGSIPLGPYQKFQGPHWTLVSLALIDYAPGDRGLLPIKDQVDRWLLGPAHLVPPRTARYADQPDRTRRCASQEGNAIWAALQLGLEDEHTLALVDRLVAWQWPDGGWNCDKRPEARSSSFQETVIPARGLSAYGRRHGHSGALRAADRAAELLLSRRLLWRRRDGALVRPEWGGAPDRIHYPIQFYDVLYVLQVMAEMGRLGDPRCADALALLESKRLRDGGFALEERVGTTRPVVASRGTFADWGPGGTSRSNPLVTVAALGVLRAAASGRLGAT
ncbi:MAG TPA: hypothetical protein VFW02_04375, partial [Candidatus Limnocylindrales bacterium]|nr:hypothetical protein [Candidatus Limnocylindrales bacterium]